MTTIKGIKRFFTRPTRLGLMAAAGLMAGGALAAGFDGKTLVTNDWFDASFTGLTVDTSIAQGGTIGITRGAGSWTAVPTTGTAKIAADADAGEGATLLSINAEDEELTFTPAALASATGMETVTVNMKTIAVDTLPTPGSGAQGAFAIYSPDGEAHSLAAYVSDGTTGVWTNLVYDASAADLTNVWFTLTLDFATVDSVRYVRYSITPPAGSLTILADTAGTQWFRAADATATTVESVSFIGTGKVRTFSGDSLADPVATYNGVNYATVADAIAAAEEGGTVTLVKTMSSENIAVTKDVTINGGGNSNYQLNVSSLEIATGKTITFNNFAAQNTIGAITGGGNIATSGNRTFRLKISGTNYTIGEIALGNTQGIRVEGEGTLTVAKLTATASSVLDAFDGAQITIGEVDSDSDITVSLKLVNTVAMTKKGSGTLTFAGVAASTAGFVVEGGSVIIDNSMDGISPYVWVDAFDESTIAETDGKVTEWASRVNGHTYTNESSAMTYVATEGVFGGKKVVRTNNSQLQAEFTGDKVQSAVAAIRYYSNSATGAILYKKNVRNNYIGKRNSDNNYWSCLRTSSTACNLWQNGGTSDIRFSTYETVLTVAEYNNGSATIEQLGGTSGDIAIAEFVGFNNTDTGCAVRKRTEAYLGNKWLISGMVSLPSSVPLTLAGGTTFGLLGLDRTVDSVTITGTGTATVTGGALTITAPVSVSVGQTLVIPYGSTYTLASGTGATVDASAGTVTLKHLAADIDGVVYDTVQGAVDAYESGTLTIYESAELSLTNALTITGVVLENEAELTFADTVPFTSSYEEGTISCVRNVSTFVYIGPESFTVAAANFAVGGKTASVVPEVTDTIQFDTATSIYIGGEHIVYAAFVLNADVTVTGAGTKYLRVNGYTGTGTLKLAGRGYLSPTENCTIYCPLDISGATENRLHIDNGKYTTVRGAMTGDGLLRLTYWSNSGYNGNAFECDGSGFYGTIEEVQPGKANAKRNTTKFTNVDFSNAHVVLSTGTGGGTSALAFGFSDRNSVIKFGSLKGYVNTINSGALRDHATIEVGNLNEDDVVTGNWMPDSGRNPTIRKVGEGTLTTSVQNAYKYDIRNGMVALATELAFPQEAITFTGHGFLDVTTNEYDFAAKLVNSTEAPIGLFVTNNLTIGEIPASNTKGLTKRGSGTLTLSAAPLAEEFEISVEAGKVVVPKAATNTKPAKGTKCEEVGETLEYTKGPEIETGDTPNVEGLASQEEANAVAATYNVTLTDPQVTQGLKANYYKVKATQVGETTTYTMSVVLDEKAVGVDFGDNTEEPVVFASEKPTFNLKNNVKKGLYYGVAKVSDPSSSEPGTVVVETPATADGEEISLTPELDFSAGNVIYYKLSVSDTEQKKTP